ncbi:DISARM system SNF2-like helicase DrmD [Agrobacterium sp. Azo12]|uniref:DISARM system SNF2-like helicase DrmD n=1 Tax=Agrobacterium sp. Azo12 TaxID=3031129 RepID=UPI0023D8B96E|nr:DISARM system SNF2-like helicase DrmD [Agrobacterium sp. Azo12]MDO5894051.1 DISARM system SNF2-like helicase DrmD [Agrobacterium sp. Azo12]
MPGTFVRIRSKNWVVEQSGRLGTIPFLDLISVEDDAQGEALRVTLSSEVDRQIIDPNDWSTLFQTKFEGPERLGAFLRATEWRTASAADRKLFQAPFRAGIRLDAYQLLPLAKALDLPRVNLLIADDVGLGKTVEAGLIVRELLLRRRVEIVVVAAPASMLLQWQDELSQKFGLDFTIVDREYLLETRRTRGFSANPWSVGSRFLVSHSVLSDETYMSGLRDLLGEFKARSLLILDEAHHAAPSSGTVWATESQMTRAVRQIAGRFEHRLFLSATPHNGHSNSFATLLEILDPQRFTRGINVDAKELEPVMVRRLKEDLRLLGQPFPERIVKPIKIENLPNNAPELTLAAMLDEYRSSSTGGTRARFLFANLQQRLFSSIAAFDRTLRTHRKTLNRKRDEAALGGDEALELVEDNDLIDVATVDARGELGDLDAAIAHVERMLAISGAAKDGPDGRIEAILDWIESEMLDGDSQWRDRRLILFTEWDDTRRWLVERLKEGLLKRRKNKIELDGRILVFTGQTSLEERDCIKIAFNAPFVQEPVRILVCTDAAREGLNLQARCHDLVHFDLPWNPSRLEQRNGRIDRKLQPSKTVNCSYFFYTQREEDRVLDALVRKTETIRKELGASGEVLRQTIEKRLSRDGIRRGETQRISDEIASENTSKVSTAEKELGDEQEKRLARLKDEQDRLQRLLEQARKRVGVEGADIRQVVEIALKDDDAVLSAGEFSVPEAVALDPQHPAFAKDRSWATLFDELRPGRPGKPYERERWRQRTPVRGLVFEPPYVKEGQPEPQDVVQLHLEHRLVKRLISRFSSQGFRSNIGRVTAIIGPGAQPRVVLVGRLSLFGPGARRLHEEIIPITAAWRDVRRNEAPLSPFAEAGETTTITQLDDALRTGHTPIQSVIDRLEKTVELDIRDLRSHLEARAEVSEKTALAELAENGRREAEAMTDLLNRQIQKVREAMREKKAPDQFAFDFSTEEQKQQSEKEMRQFEADRRSWDEKLVRLQHDLDNEPQKVKDGYEVKARQLEPLGIVYLWPATN